MKETNKTLKEWNATIEALGRGKQTILVRTYGTTLKGFLLYPSVRYTNTKNYLESFQKKYQSFVEENALPTKENNKTEIKYYAKVEKIIEISSQHTNRLQKYYIWTKEHVKSYLKGKKAKIWILRIYKLKEPYMAEPTLGAIKYANLKEKVSLDGIKPVLSDNAFSKIVQEIR